jgi:16S rRNA (uracil1498-N3)-methyltransferase
MAHLFRFIGVPDGANWLLGEEETQHLAKVVKIPVGGEVEVTNGRGLWCRGRVTAIKGKQTVVEELARHKDAPPNMRVTLAVGAFKPGALDDVLPAVVELGVDDIIVFQNAGTAKFRVQDSAQKRWDRIIHQSIKQCKRSWIPTVQVLDSVDALVADEAARSGLRVVLDASGEAPLHQVVLAAKPERLLLVVGSEKGLEDDELALLRRSGFGSARLGNHILRAVTAVPAALGVIASVRE